MTDTVQLKAWAGDFGDAYTERNIVDWRTRSAAFETMLEGTEPKTILEVGSNRGHNLILLSELCAGAHVIGLEPNMKALGIARQADPNAQIVRGNALEIPLGRSECANCSRKRLGNPLRHRTIRSCDHSQRAYPHCAERLSRGSRTNPSSEPTIHTFRRVFCRRRDGDSLSRA
jgi:hypothetical protein